jgi:dCTP deaminase
MILSDKDIKKYIKNGKIRIKPMPNFNLQLGSCSLDLHLSPFFKVFELSDKTFIDTKNQKEDKITKEVVIKDKNYFIIHPGEFVLAQTEEYLELPDDIIGRLEGRSSLGRLGIVVHSTASIFDAGFRGHPTLELGNMGKIPVALYPKMRICAMCFEKLSSPAAVPYYKKKGAKYLGKDSFADSKIGKEKLC